MNSAKFQVQIDWLSLYCSGLPVTTKDYDVQKSEYSSRQFSVIYDVKRKGVKFCQVQAAPRSSILKKDALIIKFENSLLYTWDCFYQIDEFLEVQKIVFNNISRLDIAGDFQVFNNNLGVQSFIHKLITHKYLFNNKSECKLHFISDFENTYKGLSIGSRTSNIYTVLYNKTQEMKDVKLKAHVLESWKKAEFDLSNDVWRLEFSLKSEAIKDININNNDEDIINLKRLNSVQFVKELWLALCTKIMNIKVNDNKKNKSRMKNLLLFDTSNYVCGKVSRVLTQDSMRTDKILINNLEKIRLGSSNMDIQEYNALVNVMYYLLEVKNLTPYYNFKYPSSGLSLISTR